MKPFTGLLWASNRKKKKKKKERQRGRCIWIVCCHMDACFSVQPWFKMHRATSLRRCRGGKLTGGHVDRVPPSRKWSLLWQVFLSKRTWNASNPKLLFPPWALTARNSVSAMQPAPPTPSLRWSSFWLDKRFQDEDFWLKKKKVVDQVEISASDVRWKQKAGGGGRGQEKQRLMKSDEGGGGGC